MKNTAKGILAIALFLFAVIPAAAPRLLQPEAGMLFSLLSLYLAYPLFFAVLGVFLAKDFKGLWILPLFCAAIFAICWAFLMQMNEPMFPLVYLALSYGCAGILLLVRRCLR